MFCWSQILKLDLFICHCSSSTEKCLCSPNYWFIYCSALNFSAETPLEIMFPKCDKSGLVKIVFAFCLRSAAINFSELICSFRRKEFLWLWWMAAPGTLPPLTFTLEVHYQISISESELLLTRNARKKGNTNDRVLAVKTNNWFFEAEKFFARFLSATLSASSWKFQKLFTAVTVFIVAFFLVSVTLSRRH